MANTCRFQRVFVVAGTALMCACNLRFEAGASVGLSVGDRLPDPDIWRSEPPALTSEQEARQAEVDAHLMEL